MVDWSAFAATIAAYQRFLLVSHVRPDCDALGSELGMAGVLEQLGKHVRIVNGQATPPNIAFIDPAKRIRAIHVDATADELQDVEMVMILDTSAWVQLGPMADVIRKLPAKRMVVDHHVSEDELDAVLFKDVKAEATGRLVYEAARHLGVEITPAIAEPLFAAIATDTGWYRFGSAYSSTYRAAADLIDAGALPARIYRELYEQDTLARMLLRGTILTHAATEMAGRMAHTYVRKTDLETTGALPSDTEDAINLLLQIAGTEVAVILVEQLTGGYKISFRSRSKVDCSALASQFNGGGHKAAAGAFIEGPFEDCQRRVLDAVRAAMQ